MCFIQKEGINKEQLEQVPEGVGEGMEQDIVSDKFAWVEN